MAKNSIRMRAEPETVFDVLDNAYAYPRWVVGARRVRGVDPSWPAVGSRFHHAVGTAAGELHDSSQVIQRDRPHQMVLEVRFRPTGVARVEIRVAPGSAGSTINVVSSADAPWGPLAATVPMQILARTMALALGNDVDKPRNLAKSVTVE